MSQWPPDAPDVKRAFEGKPAQREPVDLTKRKPVTKAELEKLEKERPKPTLERVNTIGGTVEQEVATKAFKEREKNIKHIRERLAKVKGRVRDDHDRSR